MDITNVQSLSERLIQNVEQVIMGKRREIMLTLIGLLCQGHILIEDVPGVGKTMMTKAIARSIGGNFSRIQFTPDMLPSDITGISIYNQKTGEFEFRPGPLMAQIVLADEINRATPKTQSSLLEAMEERQVTVDGTTFQLARPFLVLATQNPIEYEGTFPLPEAQLDRFILRLKLGYPSVADEVAMLDSQQYAHPVASTQQVVTISELINAQEQIRNVYLSRELKQYIVDITTATRAHENVYLGASPRGSLALYRVVQARAAMVGRDHVIPDDIKGLAQSALAHRIIVNPAARIKGITAETIIHDVLQRVSVPGASVQV